MRATREKSGFFFRGSVFIRQMTVSARQSFNDRRILKLDSEIARITSQTNNTAPIVIFNASTRITGLSQNAAFALLTAWALRLSGQRVIQFICSQGMKQCRLGTSRENVWRNPPCKSCMAQSQRFFRNSEQVTFTYHEVLPLKSAIESLNIQQLATFSYEGVGLGEMVLPSIRWVLRRHHLFDDHNTKHLYRQFILSAWSVIKNFEELITRNKPKAVLVFNGMFFPEAAVRHVALKNNIRVITHEAGIQSFSGFFTEGEATAYPLSIPHNYKLSAAQNKQLDSYLEKRFEGKFSMADVQFWPQMNDLGSDLLNDIQRYQQLVSIFTNVIFDTSQPHSNTLYSDMFEWLDSLLPVINQYPKTLFVIRAHPDETRPGKTSQETVADWTKHRELQIYENVRFINPEQYLNSYELIKKAKFVLVYNSTVGLEAAILGVPVLSAGRARFTQYPTVTFPKTRVAYLKKLDEFMKAKSIKRVPSQQTQARRFLYFQLFKTSLHFNKYLQADGIWRGFVRLTNFGPDQLRAENSETMRGLIEGIISGKPFLASE
ncbi:MAG: hypothetical protein JW704_10060 [Anaerolineaceae bacterium]|nr:hypothetical protein [Anaerolineaceae bacterium]